MVIMHIRFDITFVVVFIFVVLLFGFGTSQYTRAIMQNETIPIPEDDTTQTPSAFKVKSPSPGGTGLEYDFTSDKEKRIVITVEFTRPVDSSSLSDGNVLLKFEKGDIGYADISIVQDGNRLVITTNKGYYDLCNYSVMAGDCDFSLTLLGSKTKPITDTKGIALDGNDDGIPGGNYLKRFVIIG